jgi:hypothetical protein
VDVATKRYFNHIDAKERYYFEYEGVGLKLIPKCGSTTLRNLMGLFDHRPYEAMRHVTPKYTIIRNPLKRLLSMYTAFVNKPGWKLSKRYMARHGFKAGCTRMEFVETLLDTPDKMRDWHLQSVRSLCTGPWYHNSDHIPIECWDKFAGQIGLPLLETRDNQSDAEVKAANPYWTEEEAQLILTDAHLRRDWDNWNNVMERWSD